MSSNKIELIPVGQPVGPLTWQMSKDDGPPKSKGDYPVIDVPAKQTGTVTYTIRHPGSITFAQTNTFCAQAGLNKPTPTTTCDTQFKYQGEGTTTLTVTDANTAAGKYTYVINFNDNTPQLDPIYNNGGNGVSGHPGFGATQVFEAAFVILVIVVVAFFAWRKFNPENTTKGP